MQGVLEPGSGQEVMLTVWINGGLKGTAQLAASAQVCFSHSQQILVPWLDLDRDLLILTPDSSAKTTTL